MAWDNLKSVLRNADKTAAGELVQLRPVSLDNLASTLRKAENNVVVWEAAQQRLDGEYQDESVKIQAELKTAREDVTAAQRGYIDATHQAGCGSVFRVEVERIALCRK